MFRLVFVCLLVVVVLSSSATAQDLVPAEDLTADVVASIDRLWHMMSLWFGMWFACLIMDWTGINEIIK